jgi:hypothetical protein
MARRGLKSVPCISHVVHFIIRYYTSSTAASCLGFPLDNKEANLCNTALHAGKGQPAIRFLNGNKLVAAWAFPCDHMGTVVV